MSTPDKTLMLVQVLPNKAQRVASDLRQSGVRAYVPREQFSASSTSRKFRSFGYLAMDRAPDIQHGVKAVGSSEDLGGTGIDFVPITSEPPAVTRRIVGRVHKRKLLEFYQNDRKHAIKGRHAAKAAAAPIQYAIGDKVVILKGAFENTSGTVAEVLGKRLVIDVVLFGRPCNPVTVKGKDVRPA